LITWLTVERFVVVAPFVYGGRWQIRLVAVIAAEVHAFDGELMVVVIL
jgi:hypothetical protein